ncbi:hypothetical protein EDC48_102224 [Gibbsiella quercinecans]|nr:hypothetical protein EDC48_102224 [Gibbsiella quercinecans]
MDVRLNGAGVTPVWQSNVNVLSVSTLLNCTRRVSGFFPKCINGQNKMPFRLPWVVSAERPLKFNIQEKMAIKSRIPVMFRFYDCVSGDLFYR